MSQMCPKCSVDNPDDNPYCAQCSTPLRHLLGQNTLLGERYNLQRVLGCGAMGAVYLANDSRLKGRRCAIKENLPDPNAPANVQELSREQFMDEASILARLDHPNLPKVSDYFIENGREYLVMDYVEGEDLESQLLRTEQPLPEKEVLGWADQVLDALDYLHHQKPQPIIHRDIKPANLRVDLYNRVKLVDFGLVKLFDADNPETKVELRGIGTPAYAPLEQFAGSEEHTDARSDIYALGATLYHLVTNVAPLEVHRRLLKPEGFTNPWSINPRISKKTEQVLLKALEIYPTDRYQSAREMRRALTEPEYATTPSPAIAAQKNKNTTSPLVVGAFGLALVLLILIIIAWMLLGQPFSSAAPTGQSVAAGGAQTEFMTETSTPTPTPTTVPTKTPTQVLQSENPADEFAAATATPTSLPATATPTFTPTPLPQPQPAQPKGIPKSSLAGTIAYPVFNGTGYDLYFGQADGSGTEFFRPGASQPNFSPDGLRIAFHSWSLDNRGLMTTDTAGNNPILVSTYAEDQLPTWSADGSRIMLLSRRSGSRKSELYSANSNEPRGANTFIGEGEYPTIGQNNQLLFRAWGSSGVGLRAGSTSFENIWAITNNDKDTAPAISPDGKWVAFMSQRDGNWELYISNVDGSNLQRLTDNPTQDGLPAWSPDGKVLAFISNRNGKWAVWAMTPTGLDQQKLFDIQGSPDGFVGNDTFASRGWAEERISWTK